MPPISAEHAAAMVVRGLVDKPARIDTPLGTVADFGTYLTPKLSRRVLHQLYLGYPDSAAAQGQIGENPPGTADETTQRRPKRPVRSGRTLRVPRAVARPVKRAVRLVPGVHW